MVGCAAEDGAVPPKTGLCPPDSHYTTELWQASRLIPAKGFSSLKTADGLALGAGSLSLLLREWRDRATPPKTG